MLRDLGETLQIDPSRMVMIGDTTHDVGMAQAAGASSVAVLYGAHDPDALQAIAPDALVSNVAELAAWLADACEVPGDVLGLTPQRR
jgi:phosphoglycolate phosphatase